MTQLDLFRYPRRPGWKEPTTSRAAAEAAAPVAGRQRAAVLAAIAAAPTGLTADEAGAACGLTPFSARPRVAELRELGLIVDTGSRRANVSGRSAKVWRKR